MTEKNRRGPVWNKNKADPGNTGTAPGKKQEQKKEKLRDRLARVFHTGSVGFAVSLLIFGVVAVYIGSVMSGAIDPISFGW